MDKIVQAKLERLVKYQSHIKERLAAPLSEKNKNRPVTFKQFLDRELEAVNAKISDIRLAAMPGTGK